MYRTDQIDPELASLLTNYRLPEVVYRAFRRLPYHILYNKKNPKKNLRKIFGGNIEPLPHEKEGLADLKSLIDDNLHLMPTLLSDGDYLRWLNSTEYRVQEAFDAIVFHLNWRPENLPVQVNDRSLAILNMGFCYLHGRDKIGRPILIAKPQVLYECRKRFTQDELHTALVTIAEFVLHNCFLPGQVETWNYIIDYSDFSITNVNSMMKQMMAFFIKHYRCRLEKGYIVYGGMFISVVWKIIKTFADEQVQEKIAFDKNFEELKMLADPSQIEQRYGGSAPNREPDVGRFFPPYELGMPEDIVGSELVDVLEKDEYIEFLKKNHDYVVSPYLTEDERKEVRKARLLETDAFSQNEVNYSNVNLLSESGTENGEPKVIRNKRLSFKTEGRHKKLKTTKTKLPLIGLNNPLPSIEINK